MIQKSGGTEALGIDAQWEKEFGALGQLGAGRRRMAMALTASLDGRPPAEPRFWDKAWSWIGSIWLAWFLIPIFASMALDVWIAPAARYSGGQWVEMQLSAEAIERLGMLCLCFWLGIQCLWISSKSSWRARWAGPMECREALSLAGRCALAKRWLDQARPRGLRCADLEMMKWISERESRVAYLKCVEEGKAEERERLSLAYAEINQARLAASQERQEISKASSLPAGLGGRGGVSHAKTRGRL